MDHEDFKLGQYFMCGDSQWLCTDVGSRVITAIKLTNTVLLDPSWLDGPPYLLEEIVFDEYDMPGCSIIEN